MTKPRDPEALLSAYLAGGTEILPDRVVDSVLDEIHRTRQRAVFGPWRTRMLKPSLAAAAVVAALVSGSLLMSRPDQPAIADPSPSPGVVAPSSTPNATGTNPPAFPQTTGSWIPTGSMGTPRSDPTAVRLRDGRVLVVGGAVGVENDTSAELYDPTNGTWTATGSMLKPHIGRATLLLDGRVLVGDVDNPVAVNPVMGAELYDPATGTWSATGTMGLDGFATATLLRDGTVLVRGNGGSELFNPDSGTWTATPSRPAQRHSHVAILLPDGSVLVAGGHVDGDTATDSAELYDPATGSWTAAANMHAKRENIEALLQPDGKVLVVGSSRGDPQSAELYDPATGAWTATGDLARPGANYESITLLADGTVLVTGSIGYGPDHPSAELYDPGTGSWTVTGTMLRSRDRAPATLLLDGTVLMAGGGVAGDSAELYVPAGVTPPAGLPAGPAPTGPRLTGAWVDTGSMITPRNGHTAVRLLDGRVLVAGGSNEAEEHMTSAELYDPKSGTWSATGNMLKPSYRFGFPATLLGDGRVLVGHDNDPDGEDRNLGAEVYDPASGTWTVTGSMISRDFDCCKTATLLRDGKVLVTGREGAQLLDPDTLTWAGTGKPITRGLGSGAAVLLPDGKVLVAGGGIYPQSLRSAELYDPETGSWTATGDMNEPHDGPSATLLRDGTVLAAGRSTSTSSSRSAELYDPASGTWTFTGDMFSSDSNDRSVTLLLDGTVLLIGTEPGPELYDPGTRSWSPFWTMLRDHDHAPATLLLDGRVLVAGGDGCSAETRECGITGSAVLYDPGAPSTAAPPPRLTPGPVPAATPSPLPPQAGPGRPWKVTVSNGSSRPARLFVAEENEQGLMGRIVGSATPSVVPPGTSVEVTFLVSAEGATDWWIFVNPGSDSPAMLAGTDVPPTCTIHINQEGGAGWTCGH